VDLRYEDLLKGVRQLLAEHTSRPKAKSASSAPALEVPRTRRTGERTALRIAWASSAEPNF
jgi:hypothetical protein